MYEHELGSVSPLEDLVAIAQGGEMIELLRDGTTVAVILDIDTYDELVADMQALSR